MFLLPLAPTSMFLLSNSRAAGIVDEGKPLQATYVGAFDGNALVGVAAHCWNGMAWRLAYHLESLGGNDSAELAAQTAAEVDASIAAGHIWVLEHAGAAVATTSFNARIPDVAQVGGVYTPPALRGKGYARCAVAGSLIDARDDGATRAILFTPNPSAARAYEAIGFARIGDYALVML